METAELFTILSIALSIPFLAYCLEVVYVWWPLLRMSFNKEELEASDHLARGIWISFAANFFASFYWTAFWILSLYDSPLGLYWLMASGLIDMIFRQSGGIIAAKQHLIAANKIIEADKLKSWHKYYWAAGIVTFIALLVTT